MLFHGECKYLVKNVMKADRSPLNLYTLQSGKLPANTYYIVVAKLYV